MKILKPLCKFPSYDVASREFKRIYGEITGEEIEIITEDNGIDDLVVIGSDSINSFVFDLIINKKLESLSICAASDDYLIKTINVDSRNILLLCGGNGRATIYAVYRYFEEFCGCSYFWDGDIIPKCKSVPMEDVELLQKQRFKYRGIRYFAHRGLHRFRAEHWSFEDWKKEIDWIMKKGLNMFMLRIGDDDLFQKAFPDICKYPENDGFLMGEQTDYFDRTPPWSLEHRGELRKKILDYAFERELMHPENCGTMTHWYSPTPPEFIKEVNPSILGYFEEIEKYTAIWNVFDERNIENYFKLTQAHIDNYGKPELFHTIGYAEHIADNDPEKNMYLKEFMYKKTLEYKNAINPDAPLLLAAWDFWNNQTNAEVEKLLKVFDPKDIVVLDYTSDTVAENNFTGWGVMGKIPYTFGMFHGYSSQTDIRENYALTEERLKLIKDDDYCVGMVYWPELSHGDTFSLEFFADNTRNLLSMDLNDRIIKFCNDRYREKTAEMTEIWQQLLPFTQLCSWSMNKENEKNACEEICLDLAGYVEWILTGSRSLGSYDYKKVLSGKYDMYLLLQMIAKINEGDNEFIYRDKYDIARTVIFAFIKSMLCDTLNIAAAKNDFSDSEPTKHKESILELFETLKDLLYQNPEYSMHCSFERLKEEDEVNPIFEKTLKENAFTAYNRTYICELIKYVYIPETKAFFNMVEEKACGKIICQEFADELRRRTQPVSDVYFKTPLCEMIEEKTTDFMHTVLNAAKIIADIKI